MVFENPYLGCYRPRKPTYCGRELPRRSSKGPNLDLLLLAALGLIWAAFVIPSYGGGRRKVPTSPRSSVEEFERGMDVLAGADGAVGNEEPRYVVSPRKATPFLGPKERKRQRVRERRRKVLEALCMATGITFLIGLAPPFRPMWAFTVILAAATAGFCWMLVQLRRIDDGTVHTRQRVARSGRTAAAASAGYAQGDRFVAEGQSQVARSSYAGLATMNEGDESVHIIIREG